MAERTQKRIGFFVSTETGPELKRDLQRLASADHRTLSQYVKLILMRFLEGRDAERMACAAAVCRECANGVPLFYMEEEKPHRFAGETVTGWVHGYAHEPSTDCTFEECGAAAIHERTRREEKASWSAEQ